MDEEQATFKVTDRRLFNADGSPREVIPEEKAAANTKTESIDPPGNTKPEAVAEPVTPSTQADTVLTAPEATDEVSDPGDEEFTEADIPDAQDPASFVSLAMSIASNAASALGMMEHPVTHKREVDLELGKHWIDVLGMLQKKTSGNLSGPEAQLLEGWLADLRMQFVSLQSSNKAPTTYTGRDIIGGA
jgi:hypothetical protein